MKVEHTDNYFGTEVSDPYVWMEDMLSEDVKNWIKQENEITENYLSKIPFREKIRERLTELLNYPKYSAPFKAGDYYFFYKNDGLQNQAVLYRQKGLDGEPEVFLDPNKLSSEGTVALIESSVSWDNKYFAYTISRNGSDWEEIYIMDIASGIKLKDKLGHVRYSYIGWFGNGFFYNKYDEVKGNKLKEKSDFPKIYFHIPGNDQNQDKLIFEDKDNPEKSFVMFTTQDQRFLFRAERIKESIGNKLYFNEVRKKGMDFIPLSDNYENEYELVETDGTDFFIRTNKDAPRYKVIKYDSVSGEFSELISQTDYVMDSVSFINDKFIVTYMKDAAGLVYVYDRNGKFINEIKLPAAGMVLGFDGRKNDKKVFYSFSSFNYPKEIYLYDTENNTTSKFRSSEINFNAEDFESKQVFYPSKDGTMIPLFLVHKKGIKLNGENPVLLSGYGGFNISQNPNFSSARIIFLEKGGIYALACLRGGGEYGKVWHKAGTKLNKQNVFDDFISAAEYLIKEKYTSSEKLAVLGGSNGGLLIGAVINQRPELFKAAVPSAGVMDMLKFQKFTIGWAWVTDYGSSDDPVHFKNLYSYSPLHNIKSQNYPATLIITSDHDDRVVPLHSYKYTATLREYNTGSSPVIIRVETDAGHGAGIPLSKAISEHTDIWSFVFYNLGMEY